MSNERVALLQTAAGAGGSMPAYHRMLRVALTVAGFPVDQLREVPWHAPSIGHSVWLDHLWRRTVGAARLAHSKADVWHLLDGSMAAFLPAHILDRCVVTLHDFIPRRTLDGLLPGPRPSLPAQWIIRRAIRALCRARMLIADSDSTASDARRYTGRSDVRVIPPAIPDHPAPDQAHPYPGRRYVFHIGHNGAYKNRSGVLDIFARIRRQRAETVLVMAGPQPTASLQEHAQKIGSVVFEVDPTDQRVSTLYHHAGVLLFPSLYEGFGFPVLEAMQSGCPVVCSRSGSLPEVAGDAARIAGHDDSDSFARHVLDLLDDGPLRSSAIERGRSRAARFNLIRMGRSVMEIYAEVARAAGH